MKLTTRISIITQSLINGFLSHFEKPDLMIDQYISNMEDELGKIKDRTAETMMVTEKCQRRYDAARKELDEITEIKNKASVSGDEADLAVISAREIELTQACESYMQDLVASKNCEAEMKRMHDELTAKLNDYRNKRCLFKSKLSVAKTYEYMAAAQSGINSTADVAAGFASMSEKIDDMMFKSSALLELSKPKDPMLAIKAKYQTKAIEASA